MRSHVLEINPPPNRRHRPSLSLPIYQSWSPHSRHRSSVRKTLHVSLDSTSVVNKLVLDVRNKLHKHHSPTKQSHTNETNQEPQLIGEDRQDDVIFKIYLKRVRHKSNTFSSVHALKDQNHDESKPTGDTQTTDQGTLLYSTIKIYQLKAGTLEKIVEYLTNDDGELDTTHMHILFATYRTFTNTRTLIDAIIARYQTVLPASLDMTEDVRRKTLKSLRIAIICLLNSYKEDFCEPPYYSTLNHLITHLPDAEIGNQGHTLLEQLKSEDDHLTSDVDNNNNSKKNYLSYQKGFDYLIPWNLLEISSTVIAEQLTIVDADLLRHVLPYECLTISTNSCSRRASPNNSTRTLSTVDKTIEFFNSVVNRVIATILKEQDEQTRAHVIEKWIDVAHQCRKLKNFSSLTALLNGLLSGCIYRLNTAWSYVTEDYLSILEELKNVFGSCADKKQARAILDNEGTAKHVDITTAINATLGKKFRHKASRDQPKPTMVGTVPYLGIYLSDLTYIDSAYPNTINNEKTDECSSKKLINFEKHRKQFEILAQIKLFQSAANAYTDLQSLPRFRTWFDSVRIYTDAESWDLSYHIEAKETLTNSSHNSDQMLKTYGCQPLKVLVQRFPSQVSLDSLGASNNTSSGNTESTIISNGSLRSSPSSTSLDKMSITSNHSLRQNQLLKTIQTPRINHSRSSSVSSLLTSSNGSTSQGYASATASPTISTGNAFSNSNDNEVLIAKVQFAGKDDLLYKKVRIKNDERTTSVLKTILEKFGFDPSTYDRYCIEQKLPGRKILILDHCNVFYALARPSNDEQVELIVREKTRQEREQKTNFLPIGAGHNRTPSGFSISSTHSR